MHTDLLVQVPIGVLENDDSEEAIAVYEAETIKGRAFEKLAGQIVEKTKRKQPAAWLQ